MDRHVDAGLTMKKLLLVIAACLLSIGAADAKRAVNNQRPAQACQASWDGLCHSAYPNGDYPNPNVTYDTSIGLGADANGIPLLTLHNNARYIYLNPTHVNASDSNAGTDPAYPKATLLNAWSALRDGYGDWLLVAENASFTGGFDGIATRSGLSAQYPIVVTTYDPAAPADPAEMRQGSFTIGTSIPTRLWNFYNWTGRYAVFENAYASNTAPVAGNPSGIWVLNFGRSPAGAFNPYLLFHNIRITGYENAIQGDSASHVEGVVIRHCSFTGANSGSVHAQGLYMSYVDNIVIEDNIFFHNGWSLDGTRSTATNPPTAFNHNAYFSAASWGTVFRRNVSGHSSSHGLQLRGGGVAHDNVLIKNPVNLLIGGGDNYNTYQPTGVDYDVRRNVIIGSSDINPSNPRGMGVLFENTRDAGVFDSNIIANLGTDSTDNLYGIVTTWLSTQYNVPTYINLTNNIFWRWSPNFNTGVYAGYELNSVLPWRDYPAQLHFSYSGNVIQFDDSPTGTNLQAPTTAYPDPTRDITSYATANGYANETALWAAMIANPKTAWAKSIGDYIRAGYGR